MGILLKGWGIAIRKENRKTGQKDELRAGLIGCGEVRQSKTTKSPEQPCGMQGCSGLGVRKRIRKSGQVMQPVSPVHAGMGGAFSPATRISATS